MKAAVFMVKNGNTRAWEKLYLTRLFRLLESTGCRITIVSKPLRYYLQHLRSSQDRSFIRSFLQRYDLLFQVFPPVGFWVTFNAIFRNTFQGPLLGINCSTCGENQWINGNGFLSTMLYGQGLDGCFQPMKGQANLFKRTTENRIPLLFLPLHMFLPMHRYDDYRKQYCETEIKSLCVLSDSICPPVRTLYEIRHLLFKKGYETTFCTHATLASSGRWLLRIPGTKRIKLYRHKYELLPALDQANVVVIPSLNMYNLPETVYAINHGCYVVTKRNILSEELSLGNRNGFLVDSSFSEFSMDHYFEAAEGAGHGNDSFTVSTCRTTVSKTKLSRVIKHFLEDRIAEKHSFGKEYPPWSQSAKGH